MHTTRHNRNRNHRHNPDTQVTEDPPYRRYLVPPESTPFDIDRKEAPLPHLPLLCQHRQSGDSSSMGSMFQKIPQHRSNPPSALHPLRLSMCQLRKEWCPEFAVHFIHIRDFFGRDHQLHSSYSSNLTLVEGVLQVASVKAIKAKLETVLAVMDAAGFIVDPLVYEQEAFDSLLDGVLFFTP